LSTAGRVVSALSMAISPIALLLFIVGFIMLLDNHNAYQRLRGRLEQAPLTSTATISFCAEESQYCFADFTDSLGRERFGKIEWKYYPAEATAGLEGLEPGDQISIRYASYQYEERVVLAQYYPAFLGYKGYYYEEGGIMLACWLVLLFFPEIMLYGLVDDISSLVKSKWQEPA
jgi:hypothetical protein